jgi:hypothetical protein
MQDRSGSVGPRQKKDTSSVDIKGECVRAGGEGGGFRIITSKGWKVYPNGLLSCHPPAFTTNCGTLPLLATLQWCSGWSGFDQTTF